MIESILFYVFAGLMTLAALGVVFNRNPVHSVLLLVVSMFATASLFVMLGAFFVAAVQIVVYAGAVLVLFLFVVMLLNLEPEEIQHARTATLRGVGILSGIAFLFLFAPVVRGLALPKPAALAIGGGNTASIAKLLFVDYAVPFEVTSLILLAAITGAIVLAKRDLR